MRELCLFSPSGFFCDYVKPFTTDGFSVIYRNKDGVVVQLTPQIFYEDLMSLQHVASCVTNPNPVFVEVGSWVGHSACFLGLIVRERNGKLISIDNFKGNDGTILQDCSFNQKEMLISNVKRFNLEETIDIVDGDSCSVSVPADLVFLDAGHTYFDVKRDIDHWWPLIKPGGVLCGHDLNKASWNEEFIHLDFVQGNHHGVAKAVMETFKYNVKILNNGSSVWWVSKKLDT